MVWLRVRFRPCVRPESPIYAGSQALGESDDIIHVDCMAHVRRKFMDVQEATSKKAMHGTAH